MTVLPQTVTQILAYGGSVRIAAKDVLPQTMMIEYAAAARAANARLEIVVGDTPILPDTLNQIASMGEGGTVLFDFVSDC